MDENLISELFPDDPVYSKCTKEDFVWYKKQIKFAEQYLIDYCNQNLINWHQYSNIEPVEMFLSLGIHKAFTDFLFKINTNITLAYMPIRVKNGVQKPQNLQIYAPSIRTVVKSKFKDGISFDQLDFQQT